MNVCVVCGGSKLKSVLAIEDMTLRKGEFWACPQCTLKNSLSANACVACKSSRNPTTTAPLSTITTTSSNVSSRPHYKPYTSAAQLPLTNVGNVQQQTNNHHHNRQILAALGSSTSSSSSSTSLGNSLVPPVVTTRSSRSPSPRHDRSSGAIPKHRHSTGAVVVSRSSSHSGAVAVSHSNRHSK
jgi:hypothetical protein